MDRTNTEHIHTRMCTFERLAENIRQITFALPNKLKQIQFHAKNMQNLHHRNSSGIHLQLASATFINQRQCITKNKNKYRTFCHFGRMNTPR